MTPQQIIPLNVLEVDLTKDNIIVERLEKAILFRSRILNETVTAHRLVNSTGDGLPGLFIDIYGNYAVCCFERKVIASFKSVVVRWLSKRLVLSGIFEKSTSPLAQKNGLYYEGVLYGCMPDLLPCQDEDMLFLVDPFMSKTGFFLDLRETRSMVRSLSKDATFLNGFSFTCTLGVAAILGGAKSVVNVDKRKKPLDLGKKIYQLNGIPETESKFIRADMLEFLDEASQKGEQYDIVLVDPPELTVSGKNDAFVGNLYRQLQQFALRVVKPQGGILITSCCSHGFPNERFLCIVDKVCKESAFDTEVFWRSAVPLDHPLADVDPSLDYIIIIGIQCRSSGEIITPTIRGRSRI